MSPERALRAMTRAVLPLLVEQCDPDEILLFGSHAKGLADRHSDLDLLVVGPFREPRGRRGRELRGLLEQLPIRVDLHLLTRAELDAEAWRPRSFPHSIRAGAITLFERASGPQKKNEPRNRR